MLDPQEITRPRTTTERPTWPDQLEVDDLVPGAFIVAMHTHLPKYRASHVMRIVSAPRRRRDGSRVLCVEPVRGAAKGIRHDIHLSDHNLVPYGPDRWNGTNYLRRATDEEVEHGTR